MLLKMSLSGGVLILFVMIVRFFAINNLPKKFFVFLWYVVLLRLLIPFDLPIQYGIAMPAVKMLDEVFGAQDTAGDLTLQENAKQQISGTMTEHTVDSLESVDKLSVGLIDQINFDVFFIVWLLGAIILFIALMALYRKESLKIQEALPVSGEMEQMCKALASNGIRFLVSDRIATPLTFGILSPKIILSKNSLSLDNQQLKYVLTHEMIHIKRADNLWKILMLIAVCIHWFNPFVWLMYLLFNRDIELSCDEKVISLLGEDNKKEYAAALVSLAEKQCNWSLFSYGFGKNAIEERIVAIMKFKKATFLSLGCTVLLMGAAITVFAQNDARTDNNADKVNLDISGDYEIYVNDNNSGEQADDTETINVEADFKASPEYEQYGLTYDEQKQCFMYGGEMVGYLKDESPGELHIRRDSEGTVGIAVSRDANGQITGLEKVAIPEDEEVNLELNENEAENFYSVTLTEDGVSEQAVVYNNFE